jgi:phosphocarrier protein
MSFMNAFASTGNLELEPALDPIKMEHRTFVVNLKQGLHARPCAVLVKTLQRYRLSVEVEANGEKVSGKSILGLMTLAAGFGSRITFTMVGKDAFQAMSEVERLFHTNFND